MNWYKEPDMNCDVCGENIAYDNMFEIEGNEQYVPYIVKGISKLLFEPNTFEINGAIHYEPKQITICKHCAEAYIRIDMRRHILDKLFEERDKLCPISRAVYTPGNPDYEEFLKKRGLDVSK